MTDEEIDKGLTEYFLTHSVLTRRDFEQLFTLTRATAGRYITRLAKEKNAHITVYGFASSRTRDTDVATHKRINFNISLKRAESVAAALIKAGAPKKSVAVEALSDSMPLYQEVMPEGERLNRRAEIYVSY